jgi:RHS repeat-associated protein
VNGQTTTFVMDLNSGLTQALSDGTHDYIYGLGRIAQVSGSGVDYFLTDALGSVRQLTDSTGAVTFAQAYAPYGTVTTTAGSASSYGFTGEYQSQGLVYLRARHYAPAMGRFLTRDTWEGDANSPMSFNKWGYAFSNPIRYVDPQGTTPYYWTLATFKDERQNPTRNLWQLADMLRIEQDLWDVAKAYARAYNTETVRLWNETCLGFYDPRPDLMSPKEAFLIIHKGPIEIVRVADESGAWGESQSPSRIHIFAGTTSSDIVSHPRFIVHEVGHSFDSALGATIGRKIGWNNGKMVIKENRLGRLELTNNLYDTRGGFFGPTYQWQFSKDLGGYNAELGTDGRGEIFADMFVGWVYNKWEQKPNSNELSTLGGERKEYMDLRMQKWVYGVIQVRTGKVMIPYVENGKVVYRSYH